MKRILLPITFLALFMISASAHALPVFSANGFICGKEGTTVTCKGPIPGGTDSVTGTGHNLVYLTINTKDKANGQPIRFTYFSDTGCLIGYSFNAAGNPVSAVAVHRNGTKRPFEFNEQKYEEIIDYCVQETPAKGTAAAPSEAAPAPEPAAKPATAQKVVSPAAKSTSPAKKATAAGAVNKNN